MSLLPDEASFEERVQECFLAHRGAGLMLSALDLQLVDGWSSRGVPYDVVARGIRRGAERAMFDARPGEPVLRSLRSCRKDVEAEFKKHLTRAEGAEEAPAAATVRARARPSPPVDARVKKARAALQKLAREKPELAPAVHHLCEQVLPREPMPSDLDERLEAGLLRQLAFAERLALLREGRALALEATVLSPRARRLALRFHRGALLRRQLGLAAFW